MLDWTAIAHPGLEAVVARELADAGRAPVLDRGAVTFQASLEDGAALAGRLHTPDRLLLRVVQGPARSYEQLAALVRRADWTPYLRARMPIEVAVSSRKSKLRHRDAVSRKVERALADALRGAGPTPKGKLPTQRVQVRLDEDHAEVSICAGGELLHRRGWRSRAGKAPLRENLAASLLFIAGWEPGEALLDPFCGSGTLPIEAALLAQRAGPFVGRTLACAAWPACKGPAAPPRRPGAADELLVGSDREPKALAAADAQGRAAGVLVRWQHLDVREVEPPAPTGVVVTNPPYGRRLGENVRGVYVTFGHVLRERFAGWRAVFLSPTPDLARRVDRHAERITAFSNGGTKVGVYGLEL